MWFEGCKRGRLHLIFVFLLSLLQALSSNGLSMGFRDLVLWCRWQITFWKTRSLWRHQERSACDETTMWRYIEPNKFYEEFNSWLSPTEFCSTSLEINEEFNICPCWTCVTFQAREGCRRLGAVWEFRRSERRKKLSNLARRGDPLSWLGFHLKLIKIDRKGLNKCNYYQII